MKGCNHCGYRENHYALQFDHIQPIERKAGSDTRTIGTAIYHGRARFKAWLQRVQILCANCHAIKSAKESLERNKRKNNETTSI